MINTTQSDTTERMRVVNGTCQDFFEFRMVSNEYLFTYTVCTTRLWGKFFIYIKATYVKEHSQNKY